MGLRFHDLRHTGNTLAAVAGATTKELMARAGHSTADAALRYQHATQERDKTIAASWERRSGKPGAKTLLPSSHCGPSRYRGCVYRMSRPGTRLTVRLSDRRGTGVARIRRAARPRLVPTAPTCGFLRASEGNRTPVLSLGSWWRRIVVNGAGPSWLVSGGVRLVLNSPERRRPRDKRAIRRAKRRPTRR
jgi:hypothetical protein